MGPVVEIIMLVAIVALALWNLYLSGEIRKLWGMSAHLSRINNDLRKQLTEKKTTKKTTKKEK